MTPVAVIRMRCTFLFAVVSIPHVEVDMRLRSERPLGVVDGSMRNKSVQASARGCTPLVVDASCEAVRFTHPWLTKTEI